MSTHQRLVNLLATRSLRRGEFRLASGSISDTYIDARLTTMSSEGLELIGSLGAQLVKDHFPSATAVGGLTLGADPVAYAIAYASNGWLNAFTVRKEPKDHGTSRLIEGPVTPADRAVVIEDVITTGGSARRACAALEQAGIPLLGIMAVVDREEGGRETLTQAGYTVVTLTTMSEIAAIPAGRVP